MLKTRAQKGYLKRYLLFNLREKGGVLLLGGVFLMGTVLGVRLLYGDGGQLRQIMESLFGAQTEIAQYQGFLPDFFTALWGTGVLLGILFLCGFCAIGQPAILFVLLFKGLGFGLTGAFLYSCGDKGAVLYYVLVLLPETIGAVILLVAAAKEAIGFTLTFAQVVLPSLGSTNQGVSLKIYIARFVLFFILVVVVAFLTAVIKMLYAAFLA